MKDLCGDGNVLYLGCIHVKKSRTIVLQDVTAERNWTGDTKDLSAIFPTTAWEIYNYLTIKSLEK